MTEKVELSVYGIVTDKKKRILMQKRANTKYANGWWSLPGGHVEAKESIFAAIQRELYEEGGIVMSPENCSFKLTLVRKPQLEKRYVNFFYVIKDWMGVPAISDEKASELAFFLINDLPDPTLPYIQEALQLINNKIPFYESAY
ncbi:MAG: NUDIX domain-containing protein [Parachlamydiaceae bacterium]|nr:NUDIX domain-containing protein [Parachlamydiaceae bacterium]